jgi:alpha-galactosidase
VSPSGGDDDTALIQAAINAVSAMTPDANGFRGAVLLAPGSFNCSHTLNIGASGVVLRGSGSGGDGTVINMTGSAGFLAISVRGSGSYSTSNTVDIADSYVPSGTNTVTLSDASGFSVGDNVLIRRRVTADWIHFLGMDTLVRNGQPQTWLSAGSIITTDRTIQAVAGNSVTLDAPLTDSFDSTYLGTPVGTLAKYTFPGRISQVGVEHLTILAPAGMTVYSAVTLDNVIDAWVQDVVGQETQNAFNVNKNAKRVTLDNVVNNITTPQTRSAATADFAITGTQIFVNNSQSTGRGDWPIVTQATGTGPIAILNFSSTDRGVSPHQRWTTGVLVDNGAFPNATRSTQGIAFRNRGTAGSGHGWTTGWSVAWNVTTPFFLVSAAPGTENWCIGCVGARATSSDPDGIYDSLGTPVVPSSLYLAQMCDRLGPAAVANIGYAGACGLTDTDIGSPARPGSATFSGGTSTVNGGGADVWGSSDQFNYAYQRSAGDVTITAHVTSQQPTSAWAKTGVMIRETTDAGSAYVFLFVTPGNGVSMQYRVSTGSVSAQVANVAGPTAPYWLKLLRSGNTFIGFGSDDGASWVRIGTIGVNIASSAAVGLAVTAHDAAALNTSTFENVGIVNTQPSGLAVIPPMGWNSWNHFHCNVSDALIRAQADAMVASGMKDAGYAYVNIDDCWEGQRDDQGFIQPDPSRFPDMKALGDYVHGLGLKLGIYSSPGPLTCQHREGSLGHEEQDAQTYADWGIDYLKYDWCSGQGDQQSAYWKMGEALKKTGRPIVYSFSQGGRNQVWTWAPAVGGNLWRVSGDISDNYDRMSSIGFGQNGREIFAGPGHWNDPDMLEIGNGHMTDDEYRTHMSLWCILAAPLLAGNDLRNMTDTTVSLLTNPEVIAVDQDSAGIQGHRISQSAGLEVWAKELADGNYAVGLFNRTLSDATLAVNFADIGASNSSSVRDLWNQQDLGVFDNAFWATVAAHGAVLIRVMTRFQ